MTDGPTIKTIAIAAVERYRTKLVQELNDEWDMKVYANSSKEHLVDGYWQSRWDAELKYRASLALLEAIEDVEHELSTRHHGVSR